MKMSALKYMMPLGFVYVLNALVRKEGSVGQRGFVEPQGVKGMYYPVV